MLSCLSLSLADSSRRSMPLHATHRDAGRDFRGRALILEYVTTLSALAFSLINSTRPPAWNRVSAATAQDILCTSVFIKGRRPYIPCRTLSYKRAAFRARTRIPGPFSATYVHVTPVPITWIPRTGARLVGHSMRGHEDGSVSSPLLSCDYDLVSPRADYRPAGSTFFLTFGVTS